MPYKLEKVGDDQYYVITIDTHKRHSLYPLPYKKAIGQLLILERSYEHEISPKTKNKKR
jgi:hypothetical protein